MSMGLTSCTPILPYSSLFLCLTLECPQPVFGASVSQREAEAFAFSDGEAELTGGFCLFVWIVLQAGSALVFL